MTDSDVWRCRAHRREAPLVVSVGWCWWSNTGGTEREADAATGRGVKDEVGTDRQTDSWNLYILVYNSQSDIPWNHVCIYHLDAILCA